MDGHRNLDALTPINWTIQRDKSGRSCIERGRQRLKMDGPQKRMAQTKSERLK